MLHKHNIQITGTTGGWGLIEWGDCVWNQSYFLILSPDTASRPAIRNWPTPSAMLAAFCWSALISNTETLMTLQRAPPQPVGPTMTSGQLICGAASSAISAGRCLFAVITESLPAALHTDPVRLSLAPSPRWQGGNQVISEAVLGECGHGSWRHLYM